MPDESRRDQEESHRVQSRIADYPKWVVQGLVGIEGRNESDVINNIISDWIRQNRDYLGDLNLSPKTYQSIVQHLRTIPGKEVEKPN